MFSNTRARRIDTLKSNSVDKRARLINFVCLLGAGIGLSSIPFDWVTAPRWMFVEDIVSVLVFIAILFLNRSGKSQLSRILLLAFVNLLFAVNTYLLGTESGVDLMFFGLAAFSFMIWDLEEKYLMATFTLVPIAMYFWFKTLPAGFALDPMPPEAAASYSIYSAIMAFLTIVTSVYYLQRTNQASEAALKESRMQMINAEKMAALGEMSGSLAHEINTPLAAMRLQASILKRMTTSSNPDLLKIGQKSEIIDSLIERVAKISVYLEKYARNAEHDPFEITPVESIVNDTLPLCLEKFKVHDIDLRVSPYDSQKLKIKCRSVQISQVLLNLLNNAYSAVSKLDEKWVQLSVDEKGPLIEISVTDSGAGIPEDVQENLFQPYFTTKAAGVGTGLGLSISKSIVDNHGGNIYLDATHANTRFVIAMPVSS